MQNFEIGFFGFGFKFWCLGSCSCLDVFKLCVTSVLNYKILKKLFTFQDIQFLLQ